MLQDDTLAILPVMAGSGYEGFRRQTADYLVNAYKSELEKMTIITPEATRDSLNAYDLADEYSDMVIEYQKTGILNKNSISKMGKAVDADYLLYSEVSLNEDSRIVTVGSSTGQSKVNEMNIYAQLWSVSESDIKWEATGSAAAVKSEFSNKQLLYMAANNLAKRTAISPNNAPQATTVDYLHNKNLERASGNYAGALLFLSGTSLALLLMLY